MNNKNPKLQIYQGIIEYLLESTNYNLKNIAELSNSSIEHIRSIPCQNMVPTDFFSESQLVKSAWTHNLMDFYIILATFIDGQIKNPS